MKHIVIYSSLLFSFFIGACGSGERKSSDDPKTDLDTIAPVTTSKTATDTTPPENGIFELKHPNGQVSVRGEMRNGKREGTWISYYDNGQPMSQGEYANGKREGKSITWYPNGKTRYEGSYSNDKQAGTWKYWEENGKLVKEVNYDKPTAK